MNPKIVFHNLKMEIELPTGFVICYYDTLMYVVYKELDCTLHFGDNEKYTVEATLKGLEYNLPETAFVRCNRNTIVNLHHCKEYNKTVSEIRMVDGAIFSLSRREKANFKAKRKNLKR